MRGRNYVDHPRLRADSMSSVVDPDPVGSETFSRIRKNHSGSEQLQLWNDFEVKLLGKTGKIWQFLNRDAQLKNIFLFVKKIFPLKASSTFTRQEYKGKIFVKNITKNLYRIQKKLKVGYGSGSKKNHSGSTTLNMRVCTGKICFFVN